MKVLTKSKYRKLKRKADTLDRLNKAVAKFYYDENGEPYPEGEEPGDGLLSIGEVTASILGYF